MPYPVRLEFRPPWIHRIELPGPQGSTSARTGSVPGLSLRVSYEIVVDRRSGKSSADQLQIQA
jgi:hypothetical protein